MNAKLAKSLRRIARNKAQPIDLARAMAHDERQRRKLSSAKPLRIRERPPKPGRAPTWPATKDQRRQQRPAIVAHPMRHLRAALIARVMPDKDGIRTLPHWQRQVLYSIKRWPTHRLQALALTGSVDHLRT